MDGINYYQKGLECAETGNYNDALANIAEHLRQSPGDVQAINDAGAILHCLGFGEEAMKCLLAARELAPDKAEIIWNVVETYIGMNKPKEAAEYIPQLEQMGILNPDFLNRLASIFIDNNCKSEALEVILKSLQLWPDQEILKPMVDIVKNKRPKISFICGLKGDTKFLGDIYEFSQTRFPVQLSEIHSLNHLHEIMKSTDICWFEWCTEVVVEASKLPKVCKNIVRLHRFEAYNPWPKQVKWENIDTLVLVGNSYVKQGLLAQVPDIEQRTKVVTIPNGVNLDKFKFTNRTKGKNLGCIGYLNMRKNPMFLLQCMQKLHFVDKGYKLFFAGHFQDPMLEQYMRHMVKSLGLEGAVYFDGWRDDISNWLSDKHFIVSTSIGESQGMGLLEAMACGVKPIIHNFPGAGEIFPSEYVFDIAEDFCRLILSDDYDSRKYREFVEQKYPLKSELKQINDLFIQLENEIGTVKTQAVSQPRQPIMTANNAGKTIRFDEVKINSGTVV